MEMAMGGENGRNKQGEKRDKKRDQVIEREFGFAVRLKGRIEGSKAQRLEGAQRRSKPILSAHRSAESEISLISDGLPPAACLALSSMFGVRRLPNRKSKQQHKTQKES